MLATNLLNVLNNFTSKSANVVINIDVANNKSPFLVFKTTTTTTTTIHQFTRIIASDKTRVIREMHLNQSTSFNLTILAL